MSLLSWMRNWPALSAPLLSMVALALSPIGCARRDGDAPIDLVLWNGKIVTLNPGNPDADAIAVRGGRIAAVGGNDEVLALAGPDTRRIDLQRKTVVPGLIDAHAHVRSLGDRLAVINLRGAESVDVVAGMVAKRAVELPPGEWVTGGGWDQNLWPGRRFPHHRPLSEAAPEHPVWLRRVDGHAGWANTKAMQIAGVDRSTVDPRGGTIEREASGDPSGVFIDNAMALIGDARPRPTREQIKTSIRRALRRCAEAGLTEVHDAGVGQEVVSAYRELADAGELELRVYLMWDGRSGEPLEPMLEQAPLINYKDRLTLRAVKLMVDGAMGSRGAAFFDDYEDDAGNRGLLVTSPEEIERLAILAMRKGYQVCTHAIGDRGIRITLDAYEQALESVHVDDPRPRIEHLQCTTRADVERLKRLGGIASVQPSHATSDLDWAEERVGHDRGTGLYAWRWVLDAGVPLAAGSDFPVEIERPLFGLMAAVTRQDARAQPEGGWHPEQRMTLDEALQAYTTGAAYAAFEEQHKGRIMQGFWADLTVLSEDLRLIRPASIRNVAVSYTIVGGRVVFESP